MRTKANNNLEKFLRMSLENKLTITEHQIVMITGRLSCKDVFEQASQAGWRIDSVKEQNKVRVFYFVDENQICLCDEKTIHPHDNGVSYCEDPEYCPPLEDLEFETAQLIARIRENLLQR